MSVPNQNMLIAFRVFSSVAPGGTPPPASEAGNAVVVYNTPAASVSGPSLPDTTSILDDATFDDERASTGYLGEFVPPDNPDAFFLTPPGGIFGGGGNTPTEGQPPTPASAEFIPSGEGSTGQQPAVDVPFTDPSWVDND